jgi:hypothetical protein
VPEQGRFSWFRLSDDQPEPGESAILVLGREFLEKAVLLKRLAGATAWLLLGAIIVSVLSGWGIMQTELIYQASLGLVDRGLANSIHRGVQIPMMALFIAHVLANIRVLLLSRWPGRLMDVMFIAIGAFLLLGVSYMETR